MYTKHTVNKITNLQLATSNKYFYLFMKYDVFRQNAEFI